MLAVFSQNHPWWWTLLALLLAWARFSKTSPPPGDGKPKPSNPETPNAPAPERPKESLSNSKPDALESRLEELKSLKDRGMISETEFETLKRKLLGL